MRFLSVFILLVSFWSGSAVASDDMAEFERAWGAYNTLSQQRRYADAIKPAKTVIRLARKIEPDNAKLHADLTFNLGVTYLNNYDQEKALIIFGRASSLYEAASGPRSLEVAKVHMAVGDIFVRQIDDKAKREYFKALEIYEHVFGKNHPRTADAHRRLGNFHLVKHDGRQAGQSFNKAVAITRAARPEFESEYAHAMFSLGRYQLSTRRTKLAIKSLNESLGILRAIEPDSDVIPTILAFLVVAYERRGDDELSTALLQELARLEPEQNTREPEPIFRSVQEYPFSARVSCKDGMVEVEFTVDREGRVKDPKITKAKPKGTFNKAALEALEKFRYKPRIMNGEFVDAPGQTIRMVWQMERDRGSKTGC